MLAYQLTVKSYIMLLVEQLSMALEDEREVVKAVKKKNTNIVKDLQRQLQSSNR